MASVEEVDQPIEDAQENLDVSNRARVKFTAPTVKKIVSAHSGSILATPEPIIKLNDALKAKASDEFKVAADGQMTVKVEALPSLLFKCGFEYRPDTLKPVIAKFCPSDCVEMDEEQFLSFLERYQAPEYYYGARLRRCAARGLVSELIELLVRNCDVNTGDGEGLTSLHYASEFNRIDIINALNDTVLNNRLVINCQDKYGWTPLYSACHHGNYDCVNLLLELGADPMVRNNAGKTAVHAACAQGRSIIVDRLLRPTVQPTKSAPSLPPSPTAAAGAAAPPVQTLKGAKTASITKDAAALAAAEAAARELAAQEALAKQFAPQPRELPPFNPQMLQETDLKGMTPVHEACYRGHGSLFQILSRNSTADLTQLDAMGYAAADYLSDMLPGGAGGAVRASSRGGAGKGGGLEGNKAEEKKSGSPKITARNKKK